jgi:hypothetical protein
MMLEKSMTDEQEKKRVRHLLIMIDIIDLCFAHNVVKNNVN